MTVNQLGYLQLLESRRSNLARETETHRSNVAGESLKDEANKETARANREREYYNLISLDEVKRANQVKEGLEQKRYEETVRAALAGEGLRERELTEREFENAYRRELDYQVALDNAKRSWFNAGVNTAKVTLDGFKILS